MQHPSSRSGLSLVEVLVALTVLSVTILPLTLMFQFSGKVGRSGGRELVATLFSHEVLETVRAEVERWTDETAHSFRMPRIELSAPAGYRYRIEVRPVEVDLDEITVVTTWSEGRGKERSTRLSVLISRLGTQIPLAPGERWRGGGA